jgi:hypothetical protein
VHAAQTLRLHGQLRAASGRLTTTGVVAGVYDLRRFGQSNISTTTRDETGVVVCEMDWVVLHRFDGGFGGPRPPETVRLPIPDRQPDVSVRLQTRPSRRCCIVCSVT